MNWGWRLKKLPVRKGKNLSNVIAQQYDFQKSNHLIPVKWKNGWHESYAIPPSKKGRIYNEYLNMPWKSGNMRYNERKNFNGDVELTTITRERRLKPKLR